MIWLLLWFSRKAELVSEGTVDRFVTCEECRGQYVYEVTRSAVGKDRSLFSWSGQASGRKARADAERQLDALLADGSDVVPCPACGHVQGEMLRLARLGMYNWLKTLAILLTGLATPVVIIIVVGAVANGDAETSLAAAAAITAVSAVWAAALGLRSALRSAYDPNRRPQDKRIALGRELALTRREWEQAEEKIRRKKLERLQAAPRWGG